jgi:voltage-gated potassium channel Kch
MGLNPWKLSWLLLALLPSATADVVAAPNDKYSYIVVGGGTSGLVVARRLAENSKLRASVLVVEAGPIFDGQQEMDEVLVSPQFDKIKPDRFAWTWNVSTVPSEGLNGRTIRMTWGKVRFIFLDAQHRLLLFPGTKSDRRHIL